MEVITKTTAAEIRDNIADWLEWLAARPSAKSPTLCDVADMLRNIPVISEITGEPTFEDMRLGLMAAISLLGNNEPGDSRAVSDEFVALASIEAGRVTEESRELLRRVIGTTVRPG